MAVYQEKDKKKWTKDGRKWYFRIYKNGKQYESKHYLTKKEAQEAESIFKLKKDMPYHKQFKLVAKDYFDYLQRIRKDSTYITYFQDYRMHIKPFFNELDISTINIQTIREWAENMENKRLSVKYMNKIKNVLNNIFDYAVKNYNLESNPSKIYGAFQEKNDKIISDEEKLRYITLDEFNTFISYVDDIMWKNFFTFAYYTGCRKGEIQALNWNDIDFKENEIRIIKTLTVKSTEIYKITNTKNKENRKIKMSKTLHDALLKYKNIVKQYKDFTENWFVFGNSYFLTQSTIDRMKDKYFKMSGVRRITMHEFRHSHVSLLINEYVKASKKKNMQIDTAKFFLMTADRMGHTIPVMQDTYMHLFPTIQDEIVDLLDNL
jgi:integrase